MHIETHIPLARETVEKIMKKLHMELEKSSIREINRLVTTLETETGLSFLRMEFGIPGLDPPELGVQAEIDALQRGLAKTYAPFDGVPLLKERAVEFMKAFLDLELTPECCIPTNGSMQGGFIALAIAGRRRKSANKVLFLDPGFPVNKLQAAFLGLETLSLDLYDLRQEKLLQTVESHLSSGEIGGVMWSNPNNPTWICLTKEELRGLGALLDRYDVIGIEDLAYFGMDFREDYSKPYRPPYQPSISQYSGNYIILFSSSKLFSYAGQRIALAIISPSLVEQRCPDLLPYFGTDRIGHAYVHGGMYIMTAGVAESPQYGLAAMLQAAYEGRLSIREPLLEYAERARLMKQAFIDNGFTLVYDNDLGKPLADGFYFTVAYPGLSGDRLLFELIRFGISTIALKTTGSKQTDGVRVCVSLFEKEQAAELQHRLKQFNETHGASA